MRITWVTRSFLDYRVPIYRRINELCGNQLTLIYNEEVVPRHLTKQMKELLGERCIPMKGEIRLMGKKSAPVSSTNKGGSRIPIQKGLYKALKKSKPEVILSDGFFQWTLSCVLYKMFHKQVKHVMCYEGWSHTERNVAKLNTIYRKFAKSFIDRICCNGVLSRDYVKSLGFPEDRINLGNMAADTRFFADESSCISEEKKTEFRQNNHLNDTVYVFSGRLVQLKGIAELLEAWKEFSVGKEKQVSLLLVGDGPQRASLELFCANNQLDNVVFVGKVLYANLPLYYASSSVFIIPTLQDNWSLVVPEAMACGLPILCSVYNGCWPELVRKENGWTFDSLNNQSMIDVLNESFKNAHFFKEMGNNSKRLVKNYSPKIIASTIFGACKQ